MRRFLLALAVVAMAAGLGCTEQQRAKTWGGSYTLNIPKGRTLVNLTWKNSDLWVLTRERRGTETPWTYRFNEDSSWGVMEGTITIVEH